MDESRSSPVRAKRGRLLCGSVDICEVAYWLTRFLRDCEYCESGESAGEFINFFPVFVSTIISISEDGDGTCITEALESTPEILLLGPE